MTERNQRPYIFTHNKLNANFITRANQSFKSTMCRRGWISSQPLRWQEKSPTA